MLIVYGYKSNMPEKALHMCLRILLSYSCYKMIHVPTYSYKYLQMSQVVTYNVLCQKSLVLSPMQSDVFCLHSVRFKELSKYTGEIGSTSYMQLDTYTKLVVFGVCLCEQFRPT